MKKHIGRLAIIIMGQLLCAIAITYFFVPHKLLSGGVGGIGIMLQYLTDYSSGIFILILNIPLFIVGFKNLSKEFMISTFISANLLSVYLFVLKELDFNFMIDDIILSAIFGGVLNGTGMGILLRNSASQGGLDILAIIVKRNWNINISSALMAMNAIIVSVASALFGLEKGMYTIISMYIAYQVVDVVVQGIDDQKQLIIISDKSQKIAQKIMVDLNRGVTLFDARGAYTEESKEVIYCVVSNMQISRIKEITNEIDPNAFISISKMTEVKGKGFTYREIG